MSLQIWLPLNGNLNNQGLENISITNNGAASNDNGKIGKCYYFNSAKMILPSYSTTRSICFWLKAPKVNSTIAMIDYKSTLAFGFGSTGNILVKSGSDKSLAVYTPTNFTANQWIHVTLTRDDSLSDIKLYLNGVLQTSRSSASYWTNTVDGCYLGGRSTGNTMTCYINDFRVYDHELSQKEISEIAKGLMIHYKLDNSGFSNPNLAYDTYGVFVSGLNSADGSRAEYRCKSLGQSLPVANGTTVTVSFDLYMTINTGGSGYLLVYNSNNKGPHYGWITANVLAGRTYAAGDIVQGHFSATGTVNAKSDATLTVDWIEFYSTYGTSNWFSISNLKVEVGTTATPWCPNENDTIGLSLGMNNHIAYDCSGYNYNGITNALDFSLNTARYSANSIFNGTSSYIKVNDNSWMSDGMEALTLNIWIKTTTWPTTARGFSCTESGGFNCEAGNSGYWRFPVHVYTNSDHSSIAYKYDSKEIQLSALPTNQWVMVTWVYDLTGTRTYINGALHHTYTNTSYGIHFNTNARLFLGCEANAANPSTPYFNGQMSDFRFYRTALSAAAIEELYNTSGEIDNNGNVYVREVIE